MDKKGIDKPQKTDGSPKKKQVPGTSEKSERTKEKTELRTDEKREKKAKERTGDDLTSQETKKKSKIEGNVTSEVSQRGLNASDKPKRRREPINEGDSPKKPKKEKSERNEITEESQQENIKAPEKPRRRKNPLEEDSPKKRLKDQPDTTDSEDKVPNAQKPKAIKQKRVEAETTDAEDKVPNAQKPKAIKQKKVEAETTDAEDKVSNAQKPKAIKQEKVDTETTAAEDKVPNPQKPKVRKQEKLEAERTAPGRRVGAETKPETPKYFRETFTGFKELPLKRLLTISFLWLPRLFIPWIVDWNEYNMFIQMNPDVYDARKDELLTNDLILLISVSFVAIVCAVIADFGDRFFTDIRYYVHAAILALFVLIPVAGGMVDAALRTRDVDQQLSDGWFPKVIAMRWAMAIPLVLTPVQFSCIFLQKNDMSRTAHYNWTGLFVLIELINAYVSFWVIPPKCPAKVWLQTAVWIGIGILMFLVFVITLTYLLFIWEKERKGKKRKDKSVKTLESPSMKLILFKLGLLSLIFIPLMYMSFVFSVLDRFLPDDDWDKHKYVSATSLHLLGRVIGVVIMVVAMFVCRLPGKLLRMGKRGGFLHKASHFQYFSTDIMVLGLPHLLNLLAFLVLVGRFETLKNGYAVKAGDVILGPVPDDTKTVVLFFNLMFSNRTVCISSAHFQPVRIRPFRHVAVEIFDSNATSINFTATPEPASSSTVATEFVLNDFTKGMWIAYTITIYNHPTEWYANNTKATKNYYAIPRVRRLDDRVTNVVIKPSTVPVLIMAVTYSKQYFDKRKRDAYCYCVVNLHYRNGTEYPPGYLAASDREPKFYHETVKPDSIPTSLLLKELYTDPTKGLRHYNIVLSDYYSHIVIRRLSNYSLPYLFSVDTTDRWPMYYLLSYLYAGMDSNKTYHSPTFPMRFKLFPVAETARYDNLTRLPSKAELQQDWAIMMGLCFAGMAAGGIYLGVIYTFWIDGPILKYPATLMSAFWALWAVAGVPGRAKLVDIEEHIILSIPLILLLAYLPLITLHFAAALFFYWKIFNFRGRVD